MPRNLLNFKTLAALALLFCSLPATMAGRLGAQTPETAAPAPAPAQSAAPVPATATATLTVHITGIRNANGKISVLLFPDAKGFPLEFGSAAAPKQVEIDAKTLSADAVFDKIPQGAYAIVVLHDDNLSGKMEYDSGGIPTKGYGISNNPARRDGPPTPDEAKFTLDKAELAIEIKMIYWQ
jgi:uncharacterized protein (DUF2141 family)